MLILRSTDSTMEELKRRQGETTAVFAYSQTDGKGTKGREFISPEGGGYFSFFYEVKVPLHLVTPMVAVAVRECIEERFGISTEIKWVNDLYYEGKKVCGILTECRTEGDISTAFIGVGINVFHSKVGYGEYEDIAGYLLTEGDRNILPTLAEEIIAKVKEVEKRDFMSEYVAHSYIVGKRVRYVSGEKIAEYTVRRVNIDGTVTLYNGEEIRINSGEINLID